jgi:HSP20 family molecular chaperone IbpA
MHNVFEPRRFAMRFADDQDSVRVYRAKQQRQWRITFHPKEVHSLFDELIHRRWGQARWEPKVDVLKIASGYVVEADIPGVEEDALDIGVHGRRITIRGERLTNRSDGRMGVLVCERPDGPFYRVIQFTEVIEDFDLKKSMSKGVLTLVLTKA